MILSVDLASRRYRDNGIALLGAERGRVSLRLLRPAELGLSGAPDAERFAEALHTVALREGVRLILLDGPQAWRAERSPHFHQRVCERATRTPGKTGPPGVVKPSTWARMAVFSIAMFDALAGHGWPRFGENWNGERASIESFPTQAWRVLGERPLPGKAATEALAPWREALARHGLTELPPDATHDELQAAVAGLAGIALLERGPAACEIAGWAPFRENGHWREGFIVSPRPHSYAL